MLYKQILNDWLADQEIYKKGGTFTVYYNVAHNQILPIVQPHTDKPYSTLDKVRATIMCSLIKRFITGVGLTNSAPVINAH